MDTAAIISVIIPCGFYSSLGTWTGDSALEQPNGHCLRAASPASRSRHSSDP